MFNKSSIGYWGIFLLSITLVNCSSTERLKTTKDNPSCPTVVEGFFHSRITYRGKFPVICVKQNSDFKILHGEILNIDDQGIMFDPAPEGLFYDPDSEYFSFDKVRWIVDKNGNVLRGELSEKSKFVWEMEIELSSIEYPQAKGRVLSFVPNETFSYCIYPGKYCIKKIIFFAGNNFKDEVISLPIMIIDIKPNVVNYIGDFYLDMRPDTITNVFKIYTIIKKRPGHTANFFAFGVLGGLVGSLVDELLKDQGPIHTFSVEADSSYKTNLQMPVRWSLMTVQDTSSRNVRK